MFLTLAIGAGVLAFMVWPLLFGASPVGQTRSHQTLRELEQQRDAALNELRALDFDFQTGKLLEEDYRPQRAALIAQGASILQQIDQVKGK